MIGDFDRGFAPHVATNAAIEHSAAALGLDVEVGWRATEPLDKDLGDVTEADALWCAPGSACRSLTGAVAALRFGRENGVPTLGTCGGCQHIIIEFARNVLGFSDAQHAEYDPYASRLFISSLACSLAGRTMAVNLTSGSRVAEMYAGARTRSSTTTTSASTTTTGLRSRMQGCSSPVWTTMGRRGYSSCLSTGSMSRRCSFLRTDQQPMSHTPSQRISARSRGGPARRLNGIVANGQLVVARELFS